MPESQSTMVHASSYRLSVLVDEAFAWPMCTFPRCRLPMSQGMVTVEWGDNGPGFNDGDFLVESPTEDECNVEAVVFAESRLSMVA